MGSLDDQIAWFQAKHLLSQQPICPACSSSMTLQKRNDIQEKYRSIKIKISMKLFSN